MNVVLAFLEVKNDLNISNFNLNFFKGSVVDHWSSIPGERSAINASGLIVFCITFGYVLSQMNEKGKIILDFFQAINDAFIGILQFVV